MDENVFVKDYEFDNPLNQTVGSIIDNSIGDCHNQYFHTFDRMCENDVNFINITINETVSFTIFDKSMGLYELNKKLTLARKRGFIFDQIKIFEIKIHTNLCCINIHYHLNLGLPPLHCQFFRKISQNREYIQNFRSDRRNFFHFACRQGYSYNNSQC